MQAVSEAVENADGVGAPVNDALRRSHEAAPRGRDDRGSTSPSPTKGPRSSRARRPSQAAMTAFPASAASKRTVSSSSGESAERSVTLKQAGADLVIFRTLGGRFDCIGGREYSSRGNSAKISSGVSPFASCRQARASLRAAVSKLGSVRSRPCRSPSPPSPGLLHERCEHVQHVVARADLDRLSEGEHVATRRSSCIR